MHLELTTGKDSFRAQRGSLRRNVSVSTFVRVANDGEGRKVVPLFAAFQKKLKGFQENRLCQTIPATEAHGPNIGGCWFVNRSEVLPGTEILVEYRQRSSVQGSFGEDISYTLMIADDNAPLWQMRIDLPHHHLSAVPCVFFTGRFEVLTTDDQLPKDGVKIWKEYLNLDDPLHVSDLMDPQQEDEDQYFRMIQLEAAIKKDATLESVESGGKNRLKIRRRRNVKIR